MLGGLFYPHNIIILYIFINKNTYDYDYIWWITWITFYIVLYLLTYCFDKIITHFFMYVLIIRVFSLVVRFIF